MSKFQAYPAYKDSGVEWVGEVPEHWSIIPLKHVITLNPQKSEYKGRQDILCSFVPMEKLKMGTIQLDEYRTVSDVFHSYTYFENNDVLQAKVTPCFENKNVAIAEGLENGLGFGSSEINVLRPSESISRTFLFYRVQEDNYMSFCTASMLGAGGLKRVPTDIINNFKVGLPGIEEQTQIARFLDHETARMDALIAEQERLIELLKEKRRNLVLNTVNDPSLRKERLRNLVDVIQRPVHQEEEVEYVPLGLFNRDRGIFHRDPREKKDMGESDFFWVEENDLILSGQFAWEGAVALASEKERGTVVSHRFPILRGKPNVLRTEFLYSLLTTTHGNFILNEYSRGAAGRNRPLNLSLLLKEKIGIPSTKLQNEISNLVHAERKVIKEAQYAISLIKERRSALISAAVTGKIDVRNWQPEAEQKTA